MKKVDIVNSDLSKEKQVIFLALTLTDISIISM